MRGWIRFTNGDEIHFTDLAFIATLSDRHKEQIADILRQRLGPKPKNEFGVDDEVYQAWYDSIHRDDIMLGGGSKNGESRMNKKGTKKLVRDWSSKSDAEQNITWLRGIGFKRRWDKDLGYTYRWHDSEIPLDWLSVNHDEFKIKVGELLSYVNA